MKIIERNSMNILFDILKQKGYRIAAPTVKENAIVYDEIDSIEDLPIGLTEEQEAATYRLKKRDDKALFGFVVGPQSWKKFLFPPYLKLFDAERRGKNFEINDNKNEPPKYVFIGVRACEISAMFVQDKVFTGGEFTDPYYNRVREEAFIIAVNCGQSGGTCFCVSMNTGPRVKKGFDLALTEIIENNRHYFTAEIGSERGAEIINLLDCKEAEQKDIDKAEKIVENTANSMGRTLDTTDIKELLYNNFEHRQWDDVSKRCLSCANCTLVCPTCFCSTVEDVTDLTGDHAERWRRWDSCFVLDYAKVAGGNFRPSPKARYRQWLTHKLGSWIDQFGTSGCVGCGRCITWCPVGIDITEEVKAIRTKSK